MTDNIQSRSDLEHHWKKLTEAHVIQQAVLAVVEMYQTNSGMLYLGQVACHDTLLYNERFSSGL